MTFKDIGDKLRAVPESGMGSAALKAAVVGLVWMLLPYWVFLLAILGFYFIPIFKPHSLLLPLGAILFFAAIFPENWWMALTLAALFFLILGVKDLILVNRSQAYEVLAWFIVFLAALNFFIRFDRLDKPMLAWSWVIAAVFAITLKNAASFASPAPIVWNRRSAVIFGVIGLILWQWLMAIFFLPMNFLLQSALLMLVAIILAEILLDYFGEKLSSRRLLIYFSLFFVAMVVGLAATPWGV